MFTDLVDSSALARQLGDADYVQHLLEPHNTIFRRLLAAYPGAREVKHTGDGFMATFASASDAAACGLRFHHAIGQHAWKYACPQTRVGIHLGEGIEFAGKDVSHNQWAGDAANMAARVMSLAEPGQTLLTRVAFDSARQSGRVRPHWLSPDADGSLPKPEWLNHGGYRLKGADEPLEVCEVGIAGLSPLRLPSDSDKARRAVLDDDAPLFGWRPSPEVAIPSRPDWIVERPLGEGGFGEVWLARHKRTKELRAFKFCFNADRLRSFKRELTFFRLIRDHLGDRPDIGRLFDVQVDRPPFFLEGEYIPGGNLKDWADTRGGIGQLPIEERLRLLIAVARAVAAAHSLGIIHKDLKPSNVLIAVVGGQLQPKLVDFGVGVLADRTLLDKHQITETGFTESLVAGNDSSRTGTRMYQPPEAQLGRPASTAGDVYALGLMLYQLIIGDLNGPFGVGWEEDVPDELLRDDIRACTHRHPERRLASAADLAERLATLPERHLARDAEAHAALLRRLRDEQEARRHAECLLRVATAERLAAQSAMSLRENPVTAALLAVAAVEATTSHGESAQTSAAQAMYDALANIGGRPLSGHTGAIQCLAISPDGRWLVTGSYDKTARIWDLKADDPAVSAQTLRHANLICCLTISPDGRWLVTGSSDATACIWDLQADDPAASARIMSGHEKGISCLAISPDGRWLVTGSSDKTARIWDLQTDDPAPSVRILRGHEDSLQCLAISPNGRWLTTGGSYDKIARIWDLEANDPATSARILHGHNSLISCLAISPDGRWLVTGSYDKTARIWDLQADNPAASVRILRGHENSIDCLAISPDGRWLVTGSGDKTARIWNLEADDPAGSVRILRGHEDSLQCLAISPDGRWLVTGGGFDKMARMWDLEANDPATSARILQGHEDSIRCLAITPDGRWLVTGSSDRTARIWDLTATNPAASTRILHGHEDCIRCLAISPDRRIVIASLDNTARIWNLEADNAATSVRICAGIRAGIGASPSARTGGGW